MRAAPTEIEGRPRRRIEPAPDRVSLELAELWHYRYLGALLLRRDLTKRHRQTLLGPAWLVLPPLVKMGLFTVLFGWLARLPSEGLPYPLFAYAALLPWELLSTGGKRGMESLVKHVSLMSSTNFPRLVLPVSETATALADFAISFPILIGLAWFYGFVPSARLLLIPLLVMVALELALIVSLLSAALLGRYRDTRFLVSYLLQGWLYATPIAYSAESVLPRLPEWAGRVYRLNPMIAVVDGFRWCMTGVGTAPGWELAVTATVCVPVLYGAALAFRRAESSIVDVL